MRCLQVDGSITQRICSYRDRVIRQLVVDYANDSVAQTDDALCHSFEDSVVKPRHCCEKSEDFLEHDVL